MGMKVYKLFAHKKRTAFLKVFNILAHKNRKINIFFAQKLFFIPQFCGIFTLKECLIL
jgi:hypothetical protein